MVRWAAYCLALSLTLALGDALPQARTGNDKPNGPPPKPQPPSPPQKPQSPPPPPQKPQPPPPRSPPPPPPPAGKNDPSSLSAALGGILNGQPLQGLQGLSPQLPKGPDTFTNKGKPKAPGFPGGGWSPGGRGGGEGGHSLHRAIDPSDMDGSSASRRPVGEER